MKHTLKKSSAETQQWMARRGQPVAKSASWEELTHLLPDEYHFSVKISKSTTTITIHKSKENIDLTVDSSEVWDGVEIDFAGIYKMVVEWVMCDYPAKKRRTKTSKVKVSR